MAEAGGDRVAIGVSGRWLDRMSDQGVWVAIVLLAAVAAMLAPEFFRVDNLQDVLRRSSILGIVTMGQVLVLMTAGLDISVAAVIGLTAVAIAESTAPGGPGWLSGSWWRSSSPSASGRPTERSSPDAGYHRSWLPSECSCSSRVRGSPTRAGP